MNTKQIKLILFWFPRILAILIALFIFVMSLDSFQSQDWFVAFIMNSLPAAFLLLCTIVAMRNELVGGVLVIILSILLPVIINYPLFMVIPIALVGVLFIVSAYNGQKQVTRKKA